MNGLEKIDMVSFFKGKAQEEELKEQECRSRMLKMSEMNRTVEAARASEDMRKHQYTAKRFREIAADLEG